MTEWSAVDWIRQESCAEAWSVIFCVKIKNKFAKQNSVQCYTCVLKVLYELPDGISLGIETCRTVECH